jgi:hypothetical protein
MQLMGPPVAAGGARQAIRALIAADGADGP